MAGESGSAGSFAGEGGGSSGGAATTEFAGTGAGGDGSSGEGGSREGGSGEGGGTNDCPTEEKRCGGACVAIDDPAYGCDPTLCSAERCPDPAGRTLACDAGECVIAECGPPSSANLLPNPGFDGSAQPWAPVASYSSSDSHSCSGSGSVGLLSISQQISHCLPATGGETYFMTFDFMSTEGDTGYCGVGFYSTANCDVDAMENSFEASVSGPSGMWRQAVTTSATANSNVVSMQFYCIAALGFGYYDQLYLGQTDTTF